MFNLFCEFQPIHPVEHTPHGLPTLSNYYSEATTLFHRFSLPGNPRTVKTKEFWIINWTILIKQIMIVIFGLKMIWLFILKKMKLVEMGLIDGWIIYMENL